MGPAGKEQRDGTPPANYLPDGGDYNSLIHFRRWAIESYAAYYVAQDDIVALKLWSPGVTTQVNISARFQTPAGNIAPMFFTVNQNTVGTTPFTQTLFQGEGVLLSATIETPTAQRGIAFVALEIVRGRGSGDATTGQLLVSGYPGQGFAIAFPQTPASGPLDGRGLMQATTVTSPAPAADWTFTVPAGVNMIIRAVHTQLVTSATVANRVPHLIVKDGSGNVVVNVPTNANIAASLTTQVEWATTLGLVNFDGVLTGNFPMEIRAQGGWTVGTVTTAIQAGDQWSAIVITNEQFIQA